MQGATTERLRDLASRIRKHQSQLVGMLKRTAVIARALGTALIEAKQIVRANNDSWMRWLKINCEALEGRQAQKYMRLARRWSDLEAAGHNPETMTIDQCMRVLANTNTAVLSLYPAVLVRIVYEATQDKLVPVATKVHVGTPADLEEITKAFTGKQRSSDAAADALLQWAKNSKSGDCLQSASAVLLRVPSHTTNADFVADASGYRTTQNLNT